MKREITKNNVQQAILKSLAVAFSLALLSVTVNAQDFWKSIYENNGFKEITLAMVEVNNEKTTESNDAKSYSALLEVESEEALEVENWMMNENNFGIFIFIEEENEPHLEVENWMTEDSYFNASTNELTEEYENVLEVEEWMLNDDLFNGNMETNQPLVLENWMISENVWNN